jgi:hypothetical protein
MCFGQSDGARCETYVQKSGRSLGLGCESARTRRRTVVSTTSPPLGATGAGFTLHLCRAAHAGDRDRHGYTRFPQGLPRFSGAVLAGVGLVHRGVNTSVPRRCNTKAIAKLAENHHFVLESRSFYRRGAILAQISAHANRAGRFHPFAVSGSVRCALPSAVPIYAG